MPRITYTHRNLRIYEHYQCQTDCYELPKWKRLLVIQIKDTKSNYGKSYSGKQLTDRGKREREQKIAEQGKNHNTKTKTWRIQIIGQEKFLKGSDSESFLLSCCCVNAQLGFQKCFVQSKTWGKVKHYCMRERWLFLVFSCPRNSKNGFS